MKKVFTALLVFVCSLVSLLYVVDWHYNRVSFSEAEKELCQTTSQPFLVRVHTEEGFSLTYACSKKRKRGEIFIKSIPVRSLDALCEDESRVMTYHENIFVCSGEVFPEGRYNTSLVYI